MITKQHYTKEEIEELAAEIAELDKENADDNDNDSNSEVLQE